MDQKRIGQYIQQLRKANKMTQKELADRIGVSDKTVSKWENGNSMPDISLFSELCCVLNTNINELLSGEQLSLEKYTSKAEENIITLLEENQAGRKAGWVQIGMGILTLVIGIYLMLALYFGGSPWTEFKGFLDTPEIVIILLLETASILLGGAKKIEDIIRIARKTIIPTGTLLTLIGAGNAFNHTIDVITVFPSMQIALLPLLYAVFLYILLVVAESRMYRQH